jgi:small subunit ribosomal protein S21
MSDTADNTAPFGKERNNKPEAFENRRDSYQRRPSSDDDTGEERQKLGAMEVSVDHSIERAIKVLKRKLIKEGLFKELKARKYYEKPCERKKRKSKESLKKLRKEEARSKKNNLLI